MSEDLVSGIAAIIITATVCIGIDASLTSTGMAAVHDDYHVFLHTITSTGKRADGLTERASRLHGITEAVRDYLADTDRWHGLALVVIEGPSMVWYFRGQPHVHTWVNIRAPKPA